MAFRREATIRKAEKYVSKGRIESAIDEYRKVLENTPTDVNTLNRVGDLYARIERFDEAVRLFTQIAEQYRREGFFVKAIAIYKKIIKLDPSSLPVYEKLAELYAEQGLVTEARAQFQVLADYYQKHDNAASAITVYQRMAELEPDNPTFQLKLAELFASRRLVDKALSAYGRLADIFLVDGSIDEAAKVYLEALEVSGEDLDFVSRAVRGLFEAGNRPAAERVLRRATELNPEAEFIGARIGLTEAAAPKAPELDSAFAAAAATVPAEVAAEPDDDVYDLTPIEMPPVESVEPLAVDGNLDSAGEANDDGPLEFELDIEELDSRDDIDLGDLDVELEAPDEAPALDLGFAPDAEELPDLAAEPAVPDPVVADAGAIDDAASDPRDPAVAAKLIAEAEQAAASSDEVFVFEIDLDDDEMPDSQVAPPSDMLDKPIGVLGTESDEEIELEVIDDSEPSTPPDAGDIDLESLDLEDVALEDDDLEEPTAEPDAPIEIDWSLDPEDELAAANVDTPAVDADESEVIEIDLEGDDHGPAEVDVEAPADEALSDAAEIAAPAESELEVFEIGPIDDDSVDIELDIEALEALAATDVSMVVPEAGPETGSEAEPEARAEQERDAEAEPEASDVAEVAEVVPLPPVEISDPPSGSLSAVRREEDLLAEAQVFAKYGLREKAEERLRELWNLNPDNLEGLALKTRLLLEDGDHEAVMVEANNLAEAGERLGASAMWQALSAHLAEVGFGIEDDRVVSLPGATPDSDRISAFLEGLDREADVAIPVEEADPVAEAVEATPGPSDEALTGEIDSALDSFFDAQPGTPAAARSEDPATPSPTAPAAAGAAASAGDVDMLDESGMSWLEEGPPAADDKPAAEAEPLFEEDDDFFDLAAEIERELEEEESAAEVKPTSSKEPSLEEIVEGFKRGVAEHLSPEDYDTHFNLGIAYREMGLLDEAIGEFQLASKDPRYLAESSSMLGMSFVEKGLPDLAIKWYRKGLAAPDLEESATLGLLYDLASAFEQSGDEEAAQRTWVEVYGINSTYRDVASRVASSA